jgi:hypothetical protein
MKSPYRIRFDTAMDTSIKYSRATGTTINAEAISRIEKEIFNTTELAPSTNDMRLYPFEEGFDFDTFLAYLYSISNDGNYIGNSLDYLERIAKNIDITIQLEELSLRSTERIGLKFLGLLSASTFIEGITREIKFPEEALVTDLSLSLSGGMLSLVPLEEGQNLPIIYSDDDVFFKIIQQTTFTGFNVSGSRSSILNNSFRRGVTVSVYTVNVEEVAVEFRLQTRYTNTDVIRIDLNPGIVGMRIVVLRLESPGKQLEVLTDTLINQESIDIPLNGNARELIIRMYKNFPDITTSERNEYQFSLEKVVGKSNKTVREGSMITTSIELPEGTEYVALLAEDYKPEGSSIRYQIAPLERENDPDEVVSFISIKPNNQSPAINLIDNEYPPDRFISLSRSSSNYVIKKTNRWNINTIDSYRIPLYNILEGINGDVGNNLKIENGKLLPKDNSTSIEEDGIILYNGIQDWEKVIERPTVIDRVENVEVLSKINPISQWFDPVPLIEPIEISVKPPADTNTFEVIYAPEGYENIVILDEENRQLASVINSVTGSGPYTVSINNVLEANRAYNISYTCKLRTNTTIDETSLQVSIENVVLERGVEYIYSPVNKSIILKRGTVPKTDSSPVFFSYDRTTIEENDVRFFRTWLLLDRRQRITITPFTQLEINTGNFHRVNDQNFSLENEVVLDEGIHKIESTQPYPSAIGVTNSEDFNFYTNEFSDANIDLTGLTYRAYPLPMRRVSVTDMEYNIPEISRTNFVFDEGRILVNSKPTWIEQSKLNLSTTAGAVGDYLLNRYLDKESQKNISNPEAYELVVKYKSAGAKRFIKVKVDMTREGIISPRVTKLGIVPIQA